jgi:nitroreductase
MKPRPAHESTWGIDEHDFPHGGSATAQAKFLLGYAVLAPSSHNTQPWKFAITEDGTIKVFLDEAGWLKVADADRRELHLSVGCALENLLLAARHFGFAPGVAYFPEPSEQAFVASVALAKAGGRASDGDAALFAAITVRHTHHHTFDSRPVAPELLRQLQGCCDEPGIQLCLTGDGNIRRKVDDLIARSDAATFANPEWRAELAHWIGQGVFGTPWLISQLGSLATAYLNLGGFTERSDKQVLLSAPVLGLLAATENDRVSQVKAGRIFERIYLTAARHGLGVRPMSQICQIPETKAELARLIPPPGGFPLQPFLLGHAELAKDHTPRKTVEEVLR